jgi:SAM-dependent methyltransferase
METDKVFAGPVPQLYDWHLGPILFQPFAEVVAERLGRTDRDILETAAGTGIVTRAIGAALPHSTILATDLNQAMLDVAAAKAPAGDLKWQQADAQSLPFEAGSFDVVVCGFGIMFMPDKQAAYREVRRVLRPEGRFIFTVWDRIETNPHLYRLGSYRDQSAHAHYGRHGRETVSGRPSSLSRPDALRVQRQGTDRARAAGGRLHLRCD